MDVLVYRKIISWQVQMLDLCAKITYVPSSREFSNKKWSTSWMSFFVIFNPSFLKFELDFLVRRGKFSCFCVQKISHSSGDSGIHKKSFEKMTESDGVCKHCQNKEQGRKHKNLNLAPSRWPPEVSIWCLCGKGYICLATHAVVFATDLGLECHKWG